MRARNYARAFPRVSARPGILQHRIAKFFLLSYSLHFSKHFDTLFTFFRPVIMQLAAVKVERTRRPALSVSTIHGQKHAYTKFILTLQNGIDTPQFLSYLNRLWVGDMISCLIWPSINSWRHHNGLRTQNFNLPIMTSADF